MKTIYHAYYYDLTKPVQAEEYAKLCERLKGYSKFKAIGDYYSLQHDGTQIELDTTHIFNTQWNSNVGKVFDWAEQARFDQYGHEINTSVNGHWLELTQEMITLREATFQCGYCGHQSTTIPTLAFCDQCIDSEYLKASDLHLLRIRSVASTQARQPLNEAESAYLLPLYKHAQLHVSTQRGKARIAKERVQLLKEYDDTVANARAKYEGMLWLMDHGINTSNVIYYSHTGRFCFGWREKELYGNLVDILVEFPFDYDIKQA